MHCGGGYQLGACATAIDYSSIRVAPEQAQNMVLLTRQAFGARDNIFLRYRSGTLSV